MASDDLRDQRNRRYVRATDRIAMAHCGTCERPMVFHHDRCEECGGPPQEAE